MGKVEFDLANLFLARIKTRLLVNNQNWLSICCGDTGSGKSYSAMTMAKAISPRFNVNNVVFTPEDFLKRITDRANLRKGDVIIFDEAGVGMSARDWYSIQNKLLGNVLQTFRILNIGVIFTTPNLGFIDLQARKLFHNYFETECIDREKEITYLKCYDIEHNSMIDKTYYKKPIFDIEGKFVKMEYLGLPKPYEELVEAYESKKANYTHELNDSALRIIQQLSEKPKEKKPIDIQKVKDDIISNKDKYLKEYNRRKYIDTDLIRHDFRLSRSQAKNIKKRVENDIL